MGWEPWNSGPYELTLILEMCMDRTVQLLAKPPGGGGGRGVGGVSVSGGIQMVNTCTVPASAIHALSAFA